VQRDAQGAAAVPDSFVDDLFDMLDQCFFERGATRQTAAIRSAALAVFACTLLRRMCLRGGVPVPGVQLRTLRLLLRLRARDEAAGRCGLRAGALFAVCLTRDDWQARTAWRAASASPEDANREAYHAAFVRLLAACVQGSAQCQVMLRAMLPLQAVYESLRAPPLAARADEDLPEIECGGRKAVSDSD
jgi:hypothetical protein